MFLPTFLYTRKILPINIQIVVLFVITLNNQYLGVLTENNSPVTLLSLSNPARPYRPVNKFNFINLLGASLSTTKNYVVPITCTPYHPKHKPIP